MKTLIIIFLFLILIVLVVNNVNLTENDKKLINKTKSLISSFKNNMIDNTKINKLENNGIINFLKTKFNYDEIMIPKNMVYQKENDKMIFKNIKIIGINYQNNISKKYSHNIDLIFTPNEDKLFLSQHYLNGQNGTFTIKNLNEYYDDLDMIPDILYITEEQNIESDSELNTTESKDIVIPSLL